MGAVETARDALFGNPPDPNMEPSREGLLAAFTELQWSISSVGLGSMIDVIKTTRALLNADLAWAASSIALVYADATDANNDLYVKSGASGSGSWTLTSAFHGIVGGLAVSQVAAQVAAQVDPKVAAAAASAAAALASELAAAASAASISGSLSTLRPINNNKQRAFRQQPGSFDTAASPAGGGYVKTSGQTTSGNYTLNAEDYLARTAGLLFTIKIPVIAGTITAAQMAQKHGSTTDVAPVAMAIEDGFAIARNVTIHASATFLSFTSVTAGGSGFTLDDVGVSYGEPATTQTENALRTETGATDDVADAVPFARPTFYSYVLLGGSTPTFNSLDGLICPLTTQAQFILQYPFEVDQLYTLSFVCPNLPATAIIQAWQDQSFTHAPGSFTVAPLPRLRKIGNHYKVSFYANAQGAGPYPTIGIVLRIDNVAPLTDPVTATDFRIVKGSTRPTHAKTPAVVMEDTRVAARNYWLANADRRLESDKTKLTVVGSSIAEGYTGAGGTQSNWPTQLQTRLTATGKTCTVTNRGLRGSSSIGIGARVNTPSALVTIVGGSIPATATAVDLAFVLPIDFFNGFSVAAGLEPMAANIAGRAGTISRSGATYRFTPVAASGATAVAGQVPIITDPGLAARDQIFVAEFGRNDEFTPWFVSRSALADYVDGYVERAIDYLSARYKYFVVNPPIIGLADADRLTARRDADTLIKRMCAAKGVPVLDFNRSMTAAEISYSTTNFGYSHTGQNVTDDANGLLPTDMREADGLHQKLMGNQMLGQVRAYNLFVTELKWIS